MVAAVVLFVAAAVAAVAAVVFVVAAAVAVSLAAAAGPVAADLDVPSLLSWWPQSSQFRGPMSWPRDSCLGRMLVCRPSPTRRRLLRIPEPLEVVLGWPLVDSAVLCQWDEAASESCADPSQWTRLESPEERSCKAKRQSVSLERERQVRTST